MDLGFQVGILMIYSLKKKIMVKFENNVVIKEIVSIFVIII